MLSGLKRRLVRLIVSRAARLEALCTPAVLALVFAGSARPARASGVDATSDCLPPTGSAYVGRFQQSFGGGFQMRNPIYHMFTACDPPQGLVSFDLRLEASFEFSSDGGVSWIAEVAPARMVGTFGTFFDRGCCNGYPPGWYCELCGMGDLCLAPDEGCIARPMGATYVASSPREYYLFVTQLDISGGTLPSGVLLRVDPVYGAGGLTGITDLDGGRFHIDSFFDMFTNLSLDNGQTWIRANSGPGVDLEPDPMGPTPVRVSTWGALKMMYR